MTYSITPPFCFLSKINRFLKLAVANIWESSYEVI